MIPHDLNDFFVATATASASFIGLLFVAISFLQDRLKSNSAQLERVLAENSYFSLLNVFFISLVGLIPDVRLGYVIFTMGWIGLGNNGRFLRMVRNPTSKLPRSFAFLSLSGAAFLFEIIYGLWNIFHPNHLISQYTIMGLLITLFSLALARAWELTGISNNHQSNFN